jgi:hypothetical protein
MMVRIPSAQRFMVNGGDSATSVGVATKLPRQLAALPEVRLAKFVGWALLAAALAYIPLQGSRSEVHEATIALTFALAALSLVVLTGWVVS